MPILTWIGKDKVVNHHHDVPYRVLEHKYGFRAEDEGDRTPTESGNKIIHGDNLEALKSLLPEYEGQEVAGRGRRQAGRGFEPS